MKKIVFMALGLLLPLYGVSQPLGTFKEQVAQEAIEQGVRPEVIKAYLLPANVLVTSKKKQVKDHHRVVSRPYQPWSQVKGYEQLYKMAKHYHQRYQPSLKIIEKRFGVPGAVLIAIWAAETSFGRLTGHFSTVDTLLTLAYEGSSRQSFYKKQLLDFLLILNQSQAVAPKMLKSTFDGGMGQIQMEPSTFLSYAVSFRGKGQPDIWNSPEDSLASIANYLHAMGWERGSVSVKKVHWLPAANVSAAIGERLLPLDWKKKGVVGVADLKPNKRYTLYVPTGLEKGAGYLLGPNFTVLMRWNASHHEMLHVIEMADQLITDNHY